MKIGLFFGTFDPFHMGHLNVIQSVIEQTDLDSVFIIPSVHNPWKEKDPVPIDIRAAIIGASIPKSISYKVHVSLIEKKIEPPYYTYKDILALKNSLSEDELYLIGGCDTMENIHNWKNFESDIFPNVQFIGVTRGADTPPMFVEVNGHKKDVELVYSSLKQDISSTEIRDKIRQDKDCSDILCEGALKIIEEKKLYK